MTVRRDRHFRYPLLSAKAFAVAAFACAGLGCGRCSAADRPQPNPLPTMLRTAPGEGDVAREAADLQARYEADLYQLADWCRERQLKDEARKTQELNDARHSYTVRLPLLPREVGSLRVPEAAAGDLAEWHRQVRKLREDHAAALYALAQRCARYQQPWLGYRLVLDSARANPDHEATRRVLGYLKYQNQWHTHNEVNMLRSGMVWNDKFGWLDRNHVARYERGERLLGGAWISAEDDARLHADIMSGWDIETEHYRIRTNHGIEAAVVLGEKLENLNRAWRQVFLGYYTSAAEVEALLSGKTSANQDALATGQPRMEIVYFHNRQQYRQALKSDVSIGLYVPENHTAYFYAGSEDSQRTMYHEATHQLFQQSRRVADGVGEKANCWLIEGIAMYMETLRREGDCFVLGGLGDVRLEAARYHLAKNDFYLPFDRLVRLGVHDIQAHPEIAKLYSQIAAMTSFLVHYDGGRYRDALVNCLCAIYDGNQDPDLLARATGTTYAELDKQYRAYMAIHQR